MTPDTYTQHPEILEIIDTLRHIQAEKPLGLTGSHIRDAAGNQYVDLVMEGGGTLGVALLGYIHILEQLDIRFLQVAGTSAGSIVAMLLAGGGPIAQAKSAWLIEKVAGKDFYDFVDGDESVRAFVDTLLDPDARKRKKLHDTAKVLDDLRDHYGLNPGQHFLDWMTELLSERGVHCLNDLWEVRAIAPAGIHHVPDGSVVSARRWQRVSVVTAEVTTGTKVALPDMAHLYWSNPGQVHPAAFVRASMSVPVFFYPFVVQQIPNDAVARQAWAKTANYHGPIPPQAYFADGGAMSNFPMSLFYDSQQQREAPVLGIRIGADRAQYQACDSFGAYAGAMLGSMMSFYDNDFFNRHPEYNRYVGYIDSGAYNWLDFKISDEGKLDLFLRGARAAHDFLRGFQA